MGRQPGFFDVEERLRELSAKGDDFERVARSRPCPEAALQMQGAGRAYALHPQGTGCRSPLPSRFGSLIAAAERQWLARPCT